MPPNILYSSGTCFPKAVAHLLLQGRLKGKKKGSGKNLLNPCYQWLVDPPI